MMDLLNFLLTGILGQEKYEVLESMDGDRLLYSIKTDPANVGLIIGKGGHMIKALRNILKVRATLENKVANLVIQTD